MYQGSAFSLTGIILLKCIIFKKSLFGKIVVLVCYVIWLRAFSYDNVLYHILKYIIFTVICFTYYYLSQVNFTQRTKVREYKYIYVFNNYDIIIMMVVGGITS